MSDIWFGWTECYIDSDGYPSEQKTKWKASCFVLFTHIIYIGNVREVRE